MKVMEDSSGSISIGEKYSRVSSKGDWTYMEHTHMSIGEEDIWFSFKQKDTKENYRP